jgi:hypothetical protein
MTARTCKFMLMKLYYSNCFPYSEMFFDSSVHGRGMSFGLPRHLALASVTFWPYTSCVHEYGSSVGIVADYVLDGRGSIPDRGRGFFL